MRELRERGIVMDYNKLKQWLDLAQNMNGGDFWTSVFDQEFAKQFMEQSGAGPGGASPFPSNPFQQNEQEERHVKSFPPVDIFEANHEVVVIIELPGIRKEEVQLGIKGNILTIRGEARHLQDPSNMTYSERFYGQFNRQITLPDSVLAEQIKAKFWNGILFVSYQRQINDGAQIPID